MKKDPFAAIRNAVSNTSNRPVNDIEIGASLVSGDGHGHIVRGIFSDCSLSVLITAAHAIGFEPNQIKTAYRTARAKHLAANDELDAFEQDPFG